MPKVLIIATSRKTRGGITSVIRAHETGKLWKKFYCKWIETHRDGNNIRKLWYLGIALIKYTCLLPFYDIIHIHIATTQSAKRKQLFFYLAKWLKKKTILHFHPSNEKFLFEPYNQTLYRKLFSQANLVLVLSEQWKRWIKEALGLTEHIEVLYNPCPIVNKREDIREKSILFAGTIIPRKGYETLLRGFALIASKYPKWKITFAGNGEIEKAKKIAKELQIETQVVFLGWVSGEKKDQAFQKASIYCLASDGEGFPMGVLDAWAYGIPCVVTPVGGIPDIVINEENGLIFQVGNETELAKQLEKLITDDILYEKLAKASNDLAHTVFNVSTINKQLENIYLKLNSQID